MRVIQNPKPKNVRRVRYKRPSRVIVYDDHAEVEVHGDAQPHLIDSADAERVAKYRWGDNGRGYARAQIDGQERLLHRFVFDTVPPGLQLDHIDRDKRNSRRANLRIATCTENARNRSRQCNNTSGVTGVSWQHGKWVAHIRLNGKQRRLGYFDNFDDAVAARRAAEVELFGTFAPTSN